MSKVKLDLKSKDFQQLGTFATAHKDAIDGSTVFTTPDPTALIYDAKLGDYSDKLLQIAAAETALEVLRAERGELRTSLEGYLTTRGAYVQKISGGDEAKILSAAFQVQAEGTPTTSIDKPYDVYATIGDDEGEVDVGCHAVPRAKTYIVEYREHSDISAPGAWTQGKVGTRSSSTISGLVSGKKYGFRIRALGPNELESPWSDEVVCMAA
jgi:hypothetical protein